MSDLVSDLLMHYGSAAVIAVIIAALVIWGLVRLDAAPGKPMKVLWGLVDYTKRLTEASSDLKAPTVPPPAARNLTPTEQADHDARVAEFNAPEAEPVQEETPDERFARARAVEAEMAVGVEVSEKDRNWVAGYSESVEYATHEKMEVSREQTLDDYFKKIKELRSRHALRELRPIESGEPIQESPPGTYFFVYFAWFKKSPDFAWFKKSPDPMSSENLLDLPTNRWQSDYWGHFEVHHRSTGEFLLLAFLSKPDADRVRVLTGDREFQITIAPRLWETFPTLVELPLEQIVAFDYRFLEVEKKTFLAVLDVRVR